MKIYKNLNPTKKETKGAIEMAEKFVNYVAKLIKPRDKKPEKIEDETL